MPQELSRTVSKISSIGFFQLRSSVHFRQKLPIIQTKIVLKKNKAPLTIGFLTKYEATVLKEHLEGNKEFSKEKQASVIPVLTTCFSATCFSRNLDANKYGSYNPTFEKEDKPREMTVPSIVQSAQGRVGLSV